MDTLVKLEWLTKLWILVMLCDYTFSHKFVHKWPCHIGWMLIKWKVGIAHTLMRLPFQLSAT
jgi:hypothetical protein